MFRGRCERMIAKMSFRNVAMMILIIIIITIFSSLFISFSFASKLFTSVLFQHKGYKLY